MQPTRCEAFGVSITTRGGSWRSRGASCRTSANDRRREPALFHPTAAPRGSTEPAKPSPPIRVTVRAIRGPVDRKSVVSGKSVSVRVYLGGGRRITNIIKYASIPDVVHAQRETQTRHTHK